MRLGLPKKSFSDRARYAQNLPPGASQMHLLATRLKRMFDADINDILGKHSTFNLPEWRILSALWDSPEPVSQKELVKRIDFAQGQTSRALVALETKGLIISRQSTADRRSCFYTISGAGVAWVKTLLPHMEERRDTLESVLTKAEIANFQKTSAKLIEILNDRQHT